MIRTVTYVQILIIGVTTLFLAVQCGFNRRVCTFFWVYVDFVFAIGFKFDLAGSGALRDSALASVVASLLSLASATPLGVDYPPRKIITYRKKDVIPYESAKYQ